jgi:hypothetical protein
MCRRFAVGRFGTVRRCSHGAILHEIDRVGGHLKFASPPTTTYGLACKAEPTRHNPLF